MFSTLWFSMMSRV